MTPAQPALRLATAAAPERRARPILICFSHLRWNFVFQRPQHLLTRAARTHDVFFFEEPVFEPQARAHLRLSNPHPGVTVATPVLPSCLTPREAELFQRSLLSDLLAQQEVAESHQRDRLTFYYFTPMALRFSAHVQPGVCVYDCMDELSQFRGAPAEIVELERRLMAQANVVFTGGRSLYEAKRRLHPDCHAFPSSIDAAHFARARARAVEEPADQAGIPKPRLGFFGVIDERFDANLLDEAARLRPDWQFVMLGPVVKIDPASLPARPNIHWLGQKSYAELPAYLAGWDVGLMPFALNEATRYISPTKTPEFLAAGLPVVSTAVPDVVRTYGATGMVEIASDAVDLIEKAGMLMERDCPVWRGKVEAHLATTSWDRTWTNMAALIEQHHRARAGQRRPAAQPATLSAAVEGLA